MVVYSNCLRSTCLTKPKSEISNLRNQVSTLTDNKLISSEMDEFKDLQNPDKLDVKSLKEDISNIKDISLSKNNKDT